MLSNYAQLLPDDVRKRYKEKIGIVGGDPYLLHKLAVPVKWNTMEKYEVIPPIKEVDIYRYFIETVSYYTKEELKCRKGLEGYNFLVSGHITEVKWVFKKGNYIALSKVLHSQSQRKDPLELWILITETGEIVTAHCTCVAGNGEVCSHIGAVAFYFEQLYARSKIACTDVKCYWTQPSSSASKLSPKKISDVSYASVGRIKKKGVLKRKELKFKLPSTRYRNAQDLFAGIQVVNPSAVVLKGCELYCKKPYQFPKVLCYIPDVEKFQNMTLQQLIEEGRNIDFSLSELQRVEMEADSKDQAKSDCWSIFRCGRLTASVMRAVCQIKSFSSSMSLIQKICYPQKFKIKTPAMIWGCEHEKIALGKYLQESQHCNVQVENSGLHVHVTVPFIAASPDGVVTCDCCGMGVIEIKCPSCSKDCELDSLKYLDSESGQLGLVQDHDYYFQVQTQMFCTNTSYADFVVWTPDRFYVERVHRNENIWRYIVNSSTDFFYNSILPELLAQYYTKAQSSKNGVPEVPKTNPPFCICKTNKRGKVIFCARQGCAIIRFHVVYVNLKNVRKNWICSTCLKT